MRDEPPDMNYPIWVIRYMRNEEGAGERWNCRFWLKHVIYLCV